MPIWIELQDEQRAESHPCEILVSRLANTHALGLSAGGLVCGNGVAPLLETAEIVAPPVDADPGPPPPSMEIDRQA